MPDDNAAIITAAAEKVINDDIAAKAGVYRHLIPAGAPHALAQQIGTAAAAALVAAHSSSG